jgi:class 3 adenylate cyclase
MSEPAEAAGKAALGKNTFLANLRHELRTPLNAVIGYSEMMLEDCAAAGKQEVLGPLRDIVAGGKGLLELVNTALDPAKASDDGLETLAADLCRQLRQRLQPILDQTDALITGADKLALCDCRDDLAKIREAGQRELDQIDGVLNRAHAKPAPGMQDHEAFKQPAALRPDALTGRLLIVDDNDLNRDVLARRLQREGHSVTAVANGPEALDMARKRAFDVILLDILMPQMSGLEVLGHLKADSELRHIPVVMISALDEMDSVVRSIEMGAEDYLPKPYEPAVLRARVGACLEKKRLRDREVQHLQQIETERNRADNLLHVILPAPVVRELKATNEVKPRRFEDVAILFCDIVGFTPYCEKRQPEEIVANLQKLVVAFEELALAHDLQKIKTIGDAFMAACGLLKPVENPVLNCVRCGVKMIEAARQVPACWEVRVGVHLGSVVAGVLGHRQYAFDLWGDAVNTAARMESHGVPGAIALSEPAWRRVNQCCRCESRGVIQVKGKGDLPMYVFQAFCPE